MKRTGKVLLVLLLCAALLVGCGSSARGSEASPSEGGWNNSAAMDEDTLNAEAGEEAAGVQVEAPKADESRKIIRNASLYLESKDYDATRASLMQAAGELGGYPESSREEGSAEMGDRWAEYVLRIPSEHYDDFLSAAADSGSLLRKEENTEDVTRAYVDVEARLESLRVQEKRLQELAAEAQNMEDLLAIESQLAEVHYEIESYTVQQRAYDDEIDYSTITVSLREVTVYTPAALSFTSRLSDAFGDSWNSFVENCQDFVIWLIYAFPNLVVWAVVIVIAVKLIQRYRAGRPKREARRQAKAEAKATKRAAKLEEAQKKKNNGPKA